MLQDSWSLGLLVLETKWLSGLLRWQRVAGRVRDCIYSHRVVLYLVFGESMRYLHSYGPEVKYELVCRERSYARIDIAKFLGWHEVVPVEGMLNVSNLCSTGIPRKKIHKLDGSLVKCPCCCCWCCYVKKASLSRDGQTNVCSGRRLTPKRLGLAAHPFC